MTLKNVLVHDDWQTRVREGKAQDLNRALVGLVTVAGALLILAGIQQASLAQRSASWYLAGGSIGALFAAVSMTQLSGGLQRGWLRALAAFGLLAGGVILSMPATQRTLLGIENAPNLGLVAAGALLVILGWGLLLRAWLGQREPRPAIWSQPGWWAPRVLAGLGGGVFVLFELYFATDFSNAPVLFGVSPSLFLRYLVYILGVRALGEELLFRRILFHQLYRRQRLGLWAALFVTALLNLVIYLVITPFIQAPVILAVYVLGPLLMALVNGLLYAKDGTILSSVICNTIFQVFLLQWF